MERECDSRERRRGCACAPDKRRGGESHSDMRRRGSDQRGRERERECADKRSIAVLIKKIKRAPDKRRRGSVIPVREGKGVCS